MVDRIKDRKHKLRRLKSRIEQHEEALIQALKLDLNRCDYESLMAEVYPCYKEINYYMRKLPRLCKVSRTGNQIATLQAKNYIESLPYGTVAIISPWNYPVQLGLIPLIGAIAAGNKVILKPSEIGRAHV